jgi:hypothetical protein
MVQSIDLQLIMVLELLFVSIFEGNGGHPCPCPLNLSTPLSLDQLVVLKSHILSEIATTSRHHFLCMLKYVKLFQFFSSYHNLEIGLEMVLDSHSRMQNVICLNFCR